jgi:2-keto-4-pentenoate hydratase/2-oxohepta-3-ene-1,7-dioic acid hydratase in catechol pathway
MRVRSFASGGTTRALHAESERCDGLLLMRCRDHVKELHNTRPKQPFFFLKPSSSILPPKSGPVLRPRGVKLHYEVELGCIIGKELRDLDAGDEKGAIDAIDGMRRTCIEFVSRAL